MTTPKVKVTITTEDGEVLDSFSAEPTEASLAEVPGQTQIDVCRRVRDLIEHHFEVED